jgi:hypothetical protein
MALLRSVIWPYSLNCCAAPDCRTRRLRALVEPLLLRLVGERGPALRLVEALLLARVHGGQGVVVLLRFVHARGVVEAEPGLVEPEQPGLLLPAGEHRLHARVGEVAVALVGALAGSPSCSR